ncbi:regulator of G-protein signaling protein-like [Parus major]|uniref:regulator of G-protein signaling protein-like n=1 Tax=Parus major TaxID=9157 RepID=UPI0014443415|nr:regulator of G-protein signaling protein-like [Parus major]
MMTPASIASTDVGLLLQDDVFVDFFNTFLNLPVFGQTPLYISGTGQWYLWPELPSHLDPSPEALLAWLEKHRLPHFCKSSLCLHLVLCQKLLAFIRSGEAAELLNWHGADQWLLERCISGSHGMRHFLTFIRGTAGEELIDFWLITERLLGLDESDGSQRDLFLSLLQRLRATHLREGSSVVTLCTTILGSLPKARHIQALSTRREILSKMQEQALSMIQSYWLPKFFVHCKMGMEEEESCQPLLQEYQERLAQTCWQEPPGLSEPLHTMHIKRSQGVSGPYCSQKGKLEIWALVKEGRDSQELKMDTFWVKPEKQPGPAGSTEGLCPDEDALGSIPQQSEHPAFGGRGGGTFPGKPQSSAEQDLEDLCKEKVLSDLPPSARLPSLKKPVNTLDFLPWALSAEVCAGRPFRDFLQHQNRPVETHLLDLWHDLEEFLPVVLDSNRENSFFLRHLIGEKICKTYLEESSSEKLPLETRTLMSLWDYLICGEFSPWIFRAQKEICKVLCSLYEEFLAVDDRMFLQFMAPGMDVPKAEVPGRAAGTEKHLHLSQRMNQSLKLSQALHGTRSLEEISSRHWQLLAARDLQRGGSIQAELELLLGSDELQRIMADVQDVGSPSKEEELLQLLNTAFAVASERIARENAEAAARKKASRKRRFEEDDEEDEEEEEGIHQKKKKKEDKGCHLNGVRGSDLGELQKVSRERLPPTGSGVLVERFTPSPGATRETEEYWKAKMMAGSQIPLPGLLQLTVVGPNRRAQLPGYATCAVSLQGWAWDAIRELVGSFCKFQREMKNQERRAEFEEFLRQERRNERENLPIKEKKKKSKSPAKSSRSRKGKAQPQKVTLVKRRILDKQLIVISFLVDDLRFYLEMDKFSRLADSIGAVALHKMRSERHVAFLRKKREIISRLFLNSDLPPKLRVNISEKERDLICRPSSKGPLTRAIYHNAKVTLFPILMYFWRRFCIWKVMRSFRAYQGDKSPETNEEDGSFQLTKGDKSFLGLKEEKRSQEPKGDKSSWGQKEERRSQEPKGDKSSWGQKEERRSQEPRRDKSSWSQKEERRSQEPKRDKSSWGQKEERRSQAPKRDKSSWGQKEGRVPTSAPPGKTPSKAPKIPGPKKLVAIPSATRYAPGRRAVLIFTLSGGLELLLPRPEMKKEPSEEEKGEPVLKGALLLLRAVGMGAAGGWRAPCSTRGGSLCCCCPQMQVPVRRRGPRSASLPHRAGTKWSSALPKQHPQRWDLRKLSSLDTGNHLKFVSNKT